MAVTEDKTGISIRPESLRAARRTLEIEAEALKLLTDRVNDRFAQAVRHLKNTAGRVVVSGMGKSGLIGRKISATFASTGTPSSYLHPTEAAHGDLGMVTRRDSVVVISKSGETQELLNLMPYFKLLRIPTVGLLGTVNSPLANECDVVIDVSVPEEGCPLNLAPTASSTAALAMGDALAVALLTEKDFQPQDFAFLHPGGALGRRLQRRISEVMHHDSEIPSVLPTLSAREMIVEMTRKRMGAALIVHPDGRLSGIFTDGDLRRAFEQGKDFTGATAADLAIPNPHTVRPDTLVTRAINLMETHNILVLPVLDAEDRLCGIVHLHDLLKSGIGK